MRQRLAWLVVIVLGASGASAECVPNGACAAIPTFADGLAPTAQIHVATTGSNAIGNGSATNPYATIAFAAQQAAPGSAVVVHSGVYSGGGFISDLAGTRNAPIWIGGAAGEARPIINGGGEGLHFIRARYLILHDLEIRNAASNGVNCDDSGEVANPGASHHLLFRNLYIHDIGGTGNQDGLKLAGINDYFVLACEIARCGGAASGSGIDHVGCHHGLIARCFFHQLSANAVQCKGGSDDIEIRWCRMDEAGERSVNIGGSTGFEFFRPPLSPIAPNFEARNIRVLANLIEGATASVAFVGCIDSVVAHNTIVDPHNWIFRILQETTSSGGFTFLPCGNNRFINNLVYFDRSDLATYVNIGPNTQPATFLFANNLWFAHDNPAQSTPALPTVETNGIYGVNPILLNPAAGDYRITAASPAFESGFIPAPASGDFLGACYRNPPSIGAYEVRLAGDANGDGCVNVNDLLFVIGAWGPCSPPPMPCPADLEFSGTVDVNDLLAVIGNWS